MFKNILLAIDLGHEASWKKALPVSTELARRDGAVLHIMGVVPDFAMSMIAGYFPPNFEQDTLKRASADLDTFVGKHGAADVQCQAHLAHGHVPEQILAVAARIGADLIVMASHPPDQLREFLVGSNAERVVRQAPVSVLVVRGS